jgi:AraC family transcriptional regulator
MTRSAPVLNRFLVSSEYSVYYRKAKQLKWETQPTTEYTLVTLFGGRLDYFDGNLRGELRPGQILIFNPDMGLQVSGTTVELLMLSISSAVLIQHAVSMHLVPPKATVVFQSDPITNDTELNQLVKTFHSEFCAAKPGREIVMRALIEQLLVQLLRQHSIARRSDELELSRVGLIDRRIRRSVELMHSQLDQDLSLRDLAAASYLSPFHFARLFKKITGVTPHSYLAAIRTRKAQLLLAEPDLSINAIAARVGYLSSSHFTKAFRAATGTTPREFRKALIE